LLGAVTISAGDMGHAGLGAKANHAAIVSMMSENKEALAGVTPESMADEVAARGAEWTLDRLAPQLANRRLLVLYSNDFVKADSVGLIAAIKAVGGAEPASVYVPTDHSWSDRRIALESLVINWLQTLPATP
jgi:hypothetical protein